jgi:hypothetical protein
MDAIGAFQNDVEELEQLAATRYENIFRMFIKKEKYFYNILKRVNIDLSTADATTYTKIKLRGETPWTTLSNKVYGSNDLWWLIYMVNRDKVSNPVDLIPGGTEIMVIRPLFVRDILNEITSDLNPTVP